MSTSAQQKRKHHPFGLLHRYGGIASAFLVLVVCATGLLLNHTDDLNLSKNTVSSEWLLDWYGIESPPAISFLAGDHYTSQLNQSIYLDAIPVQGSYTRIQGSILSNGTVLIATTDQLIVLTTEGKLIETLGAQHGIPRDINRLGVLPNEQFVLKANKDLWVADKHLFRWEKVNTAINGVIWSGAATLPPTLLNTVNKHYRGAGLSLERILLDLHSGRIFGSAGVWLGDTVAILFMLLAMTGIWMWFKTRRKIT
jgi:hypothetical protein